MSTLALLRKTIFFSLASTLILQTAIAQADDTEIFFSSPDTSVGTSKPNVLFILDNSGSMNWGLNNNNNATGGAKSRLTVLKESFSDILGNTSGINAGIMVLNSRGEYGGGRYMYPVTDIDEAVPPSNTVLANTPGIRISGDDATQTTSPAGTAVTNTPSLIMGTITASNTVAGNGSSTLGTNGIYFRKTSGSTDYSCRMDSNGLSRAVGTPCRGEATRITYDFNGTESLFLFQGLSIPANATITDAYIAVTAANTQTNNSRKNPTIAVRMESNKTPAALNDNNPISNRTYLTPSPTNIATTGGWTNGTTAYINVTSLVSSLLNVAPNADPASGLMARLSNSSGYSYTICTSGACMPKLVVNYSTTNSFNETRTAALRFQEVGIPAGAVINSATISFVPAASSPAGNATFEVRAENTGNATVFNAGENLQARTKTAAIDWIAPAWTAAPTPAPIEGPNVTSLVQAVVNSGSWCGNNSMAFHISPKTGNTSNRVAYSIDGAGGLQPILNVSYSGGSGCINPIVEFRVNAEKNDAYETRTGGVRIAETTLPVDRAMIGARFEQVRVKKNATIMEAQVFITPSNTVGSPNMSTSIGVEDTDNSAGYTSENNNLSNRSILGSSTCTFNAANGGWVAGQTVSCTPANLASNLQSIFARSGWSANNALSIFLTQGSDSSLNAIAYEQNPSLSIKLRLKIQNGGLADQGTVTVRDNMIAGVNSMFAESGTPIVPTLYDAASYLRGESSRETPIETSCQPTHMVLLTDGQANGTTQEAQNGISRIVGGGCTGDASDDGEKCARTLATYLANNDQLNSLAGDNKVTTHTVGFALDASGTTASNNIKKFLKDVATNGGGSFNTAETSGELTKAFNKIISEVLATDTTFVSATAPVNTFNRQDNKDELYFSLFRPSATDRWQGNLKRYRMNTTSGDAIIVDKDGSAAIDSNSGYFKSSAKSWWSTSIDGSQVAAGGAASRLPDANNRKLLTNVTPNSYALTNIATNNSALDAAKLGAITSTEREQLIDYIRGLSNGAERRSLGDPIHATPSLVSYGASAQSAIIGTNEGYVQMFDTLTGEEQFAFMPAPLLQNVKRLMADAASNLHSSQTHPYGMDNTVAIWSNDVNQNGIIEPSNGDLVYAYATMGRGGRDIYALDITNPNSPRLIWTILGGSTTGFAKLGQTWSVPVKTKMKISGTVTDVLVFAGGYDPAQDVGTQSSPTAYPRKTDAQGNALYVVNARTGSLIWSASNAAGHTATFSQMQYGIPSGVAVVGLTTDSSGKAYVDPTGLAGQFFVGDMGGQVWRFLVHNEASGAGLITGEVFASVAGADAANARRFYHEPEVALAVVKNKLNLTVNIGSGYRGHPLEKAIQDRFYSFRVEDLHAHRASPLTEPALYDATSLSTATTSQVQALLEQKGWYIRLTRSGEKVLSRPLVVSGALLFNTFQPEVTQSSCKAAPGTTRAYRVSLVDSTALSTTRDLNTKGSSLPPNPQLYCQGNACWAYNDPSQLVEGNGGVSDGGGECDTSPNPEKCRCDKNPICEWMPSTPRTYWTDETADY